MIKDIVEITADLKTIGVRIVSVDVKTGRFECERIPVKPKYLITETTERFTLVDTNKEGRDAIVCFSPIADRQMDKIRVRYEALQKIKRIKELLEKDDANAV